VIIITKDLICISVVFVSFFQITKRAFEKLFCSCLSMRYCWKILNERCGYFDWLTRKTFKQIANGSINTTFHTKGKIYKSLLKICILYSFVIMIMKMPYDVFDLKRFSYKRSLSTLFGSFSCEILYCTLRKLWETFANSAYFPAICVCKNQLQSLWFNL